MKTVFPSEKAAKRHFYPDSPHQQEYFNRLKRSLTDRIIDMIFLIDFSKSPYEFPAKGYNYCAKNVAILNISYFNIIPTPPMIHIAEKTLKVALHHGFPDMVLYSAHFCMAHYFKVRQRAKAEKYKAIVDKYMDANKAEIDLDYKYYTFRYKEIVTQRKPSQEEVDDGLKTANWAIEVMEKHQESSRIHIKAIL